MPTADQPIPNPEWENATNEIVVTTGPGTATWVTETTETVPAVEPPTTFRTALIRLLNAHGRDAMTGLADHELADAVIDFITALNRAAQGMLRRHDPANQTAPVPAPTGRRPDPIIHVRPGGGITLPPMTPAQINAERRRLGLPPNPEPVAAPTPPTARDRLVAAQRAVTDEQLNRWTGGITPTLPDIPVRQPTANEARQMGFTQQAAELLAEAERMRTQEQLPRAQRDTPF